MNKRSPSYPLKPLPETKDFVVAIFENVGDTGLGYKDLAKHGRVPLREADSFASTAKHYGWMSTVKGKGYTVNATIAKALRTPKSDEEQNKLYINAFLTPNIYKVISNDSNGKKITNDGLKINLIRDYNFTDIGATLFSKVFIENSKFLGLIDQENYFNIDADIKIDLKAVKEKPTKHAAGAPAKKIASRKSTSNKGQQQEGDYVREKDVPKNENPHAIKKFPIFIRGQELQLTVLENMNHSDWDQLIKQIQNIKFYVK